MDQKRVDSKTLRSGFLVAVLILGTLNNWLALMLHGALVGLPVRPLFF